MASEDLQIPVVNWLNRRARYVNDPAGWGWVPLDPVVSCLAGALYVLDRDGRFLLQEKDRQILGRYFWKNISRWLVQEARLRKVLAALDQAGVEVILLKGAAFQGSLYKQIGVRSMADMDLLVRPADFLQAIGILYDCGFGDRSRDISFTLARLQKLPTRYWPKDLILDNGQGVVIELHQNLISPWFLPAFPMDIDSIWERSIPLQAPIDNEECSLHVEGIRVRVLSPYDTLAHLCLNLIMHGLENPQTCLDIDLWVRNLPENWDWEQFLALVDQWRISSGTFHVFSICRDFMGTPLPENILRRLNPGALARFRVKFLIPSNSILADLPGLGHRYPTLVRVALIDRISLIFLTLGKLAFPDKAWREYNPYGRSLLAHWSHVSQVVHKWG
jgi:hypothetical protein